MKRKISADDNKKIQKNNKKKHAKVQSRQRFNNPLALFIQMDLSIHIYNNYRIVYFVLLGAYNIICIYSIKLCISVLDPRKSAGPDKMCQSMETYGQRDITQKAIQTMRNYKWENK